MPDPVRLSLEAQSAKWFGWLLVSGAVVVLGCILEIWETYTSLIGWWRRRKGLKYDEDPKGWRIPLAALGLLLVIVGVVGETAFEAKVSNADAAIREHESQVLSVAETTAGQANERAIKLARANIRLKSKLDWAVANARIQAEQLREQNDMTEGKLEQERKKVIELEDSLAPREIKLNLNNPADKASIDILKSFAGIKVAIEVIPDIEARRAAYEIGDVIERLAGWKITGGVLNSELWPWYFDGVLIGFPPLISSHSPEGTDPHKTAERAAKELEVFLISKGWEARTVPDAKIPANTLKITVGFKPERIFEPKSGRASREQFEEMEKRINEFERLHPPPIR